MPWQMLIAIGMLLISIGLLGWYMYEETRWGD